MRGMHHPNVFERVSAEVAVACKDRKVDGIFSMVDLRDERSRSHIRWSLIERTNLARIGVPGKPDANNLAIVLSKIAMVIAHGKNTGGETTVIGEVPYMGGRLSADGQFVYAFSGAPQEVDDELMQLAEAFHATL